MRHTLPVLQGPFADRLDQIEIPIPCHVPWDSMSGDDRIRHCGQCRQNVYNVEAFTRAEALGLLEARAGRVCLRIFRRPDGRVLTADCRERLRAARRRGWLVFAGVAIVVLWAELWAQVVGLMGLRRILDDNVQGGVPTAGAIAMPPPGPPEVPRVPSPPEPFMGTPPPPRHKMGEAPRLMGKPAPRKEERIMGKRVSIQSMTTGAIVKRAD